MLKKPSLGLGTKLGSGIASNKSDLNVSCNLKGLTQSLPCFLHAPLRKIEHKMYPLA